MSRLQGELVRGGSGGGWIVDHPDVAATRADLETPRLPTSHSVRLGVLLALVGGALDAFTFVGHGGVFANAQTGNIVLLGIEGSRGQWVRALHHLPAILAFIMGVVVAESLKLPRAAAVVRWPARAALVLEIVVLAGVALLPTGTADMFVIVVIAFTASVQVSTFRKLVDTAYNTTMTTGNLRTAVQSVYTAVVHRDREAARRARQFATVIAAFLAGAFGSGLLTATGAVHTLWALVALLAMALALFVYDERAAARSAVPARPVDGPHPGRGRAAGTQVHFRR
ncbi:YoaK family protein [Kitasatospora sp. NPDC006697]|uniref:YoaK family protein n=1 Tax=Kitasatospora sp. NPDC006697 TaxID=3364020 RepID=UPI0036B8998A